MDPPPNKLLQHNALVNKIKNFEDSNKFYYCLYHPCDIIELEKFIKLCQLKKIPELIIIYKIVQYMINTGGDLDNIIGYILENDILDNNEISKITEIIEFLKQPQMEKYFDDHSMKELCIITIKSPNIKSLHSGYPLPDPVLGRPHLGWLVCTYNECGEHFNSGELLKTHLKIYNKYTPYMHKQHENIVETLQLTPEKIMQNGMTTCPSYICDQSNNKFTPEELCEHFKILGIPPFWTTGIDIKPSDKFDVDIKQINIMSNKIYTTQQCIVCLDRPPELIFYPCYHHIFCLNCIKNINQCPICRRIIHSKYPF